MAGRELVDAFTSGRMGEREFVARLVASGMALATAVAFALSLAGGAHGATAAAVRADAHARHAAGWTNCAYGGDFYGAASVMITACPAFWAEIGQPIVFDFSYTGGGPVTYNLDYLQLEGTDWWKPASHNLRLNGLAPGWHTMRYRVPGSFGDVIAEWAFVVPGPAPENIGLFASGPSNSKATIVWTSRVPAWRTYCSIDGTPERICRESTGLVLNGLAAGQHSVTIRSLAGPDDFGRTATLWWDRSDPQGTLSIQGDTPWGPAPLT